MSVICMVFFHALCAFLLDRLEEDQEASSSRTSRSPDKATRSVMDSRRQRTRHSRISECLTIFVVNGFCDGRRHGVRKGRS